MSFMSFKTSIYCIFQQIGLVHMLLHCFQPFLASGDVSNKLQRSDCAVRYNNFIEHCIWSQMSFFKDLMCKKKQQQKKPSPFMFFTFLWFKMSFFVSIISSFILVFRSDHNRYQLFETVLCLNFSICCWNKFNKIKTKTKSPQLCTPLCEAVLNLRVCWFCFFSLFLN